MESLCTTLSSSDGSCILDGSQATLNVCGILLTCVTLIGRIRLDDIDPIIMNQGPGNPTAICRSRVPC